MKIRLLTSEEWARMRSFILTFMVRFGEKRLTLSAVSALKQLQPQQLETCYEGISPSGSAVAVAIEKGKLTGVAAAIDYGQTACLMAVHPSLRGHGLGSRLLKAIMNHCGRLQGEVALDNPASISACFRSGMKAVALLTGPTGKPTLRFEGTAQPVYCRSVITEGEELRIWQSLSSEL
ncbi:GNAT family N-acetyltransferase [Paenibacillus sp. GCM10012307]|uniref:GNAT family N-acetyltransferase n=1 Tax=Paenibacillus roseus TaxID=2798579 RepID=A0A934J5H1_9BACL|nr:GNAT family N-acetyltransferase [Paenibacillus roseus]MBJ6362059.1 GNAT family N-acetyltransferase [Paenibacillus roseus]